MQKTCSRSFADKGGENKKMMIQALCFCFFRYVKLDLVYIQTGKSNSERRFGEEMIAEEKKQLSRKEERG